MRNENRNKFMIAVASGVILGIVLISGILFTYRRYSQIVVKPKTPVSALSSDAILTPTPTPDPLAPYTILILGYGGGRHAGGKLTDTIIAAHIRPKETKIILFSIPRDLWVELPITPSKTVGYKINAAYAVGSDDRKYTQKAVQFTGPAGGGELAKHAVGQVIGLPIQYFIAVNFSAFERSIDQLGGVDVDVPVTFEDPYYPLEDKQDETCDKSPEEVASLSATLKGEELEQQFSCRYELLRFQAGVQTMDGKTALKFVRSRHSPQDGGDFGRSRRQQALISAVKQKVLSIGFLPKAFSFINQLSGDVQTDIDANTLNTILQTHGDLQKYQIHSVSITTQNLLQNARSSDGQFILTSRDSEADWESIHSFIQDALTATKEASIE